MAHVSKKYIRDDKLKRIFDIFFELLSDTRNRKIIESIMGEIFTETEKIMFSKRLACFYLLQRNIHPDSISDSLKLSTSNIYHLQQVLNDSPAVQKYLRRKINREKLNNLIEDVLTTTVLDPYRAGSNWSSNLAELNMTKQRRAEGL